MKTFLTQFFTWWNGQSLNTRFHTWRHGTKVGEDEQGRVRAAAFLFPQDTPAEAPLDQYLTTIDEIERRTGLDFLAELPDPAENALEARSVDRVW